EAPRIKIQAPEKLQNSRPKETLKVEDRFEDANASRMRPGCCRVNAAFREACCWAALGVRGRYAKATMLRVLPDGHRHPRSGKNGRAGVRPAHPRQRGPTTAAARRGLLALPGMQFEQRRCV